MKLTIIGLLRPNLNLLTEDGQLAHLVEHLLANHERLERHGWKRQWHADRIISQNAYVNYSFGVEYAVVPTNRAADLKQLLIDMALSFDFTEREIERERKIIIEELAAGKTKELTPVEQFERACYENPVKRRSWDDRELRRPLRQEDVVAAANRLAGEFYPFEISMTGIDFSSAPLPYLYLSVFKDFAGRARELRHPKIYQGRASVLLSMPCALTERTSRAQHLLTQLLRNHYFGYLTEVLRHREGLVYSLSLGNATWRGSYDINFMVDRPLAQERARYILDLIASDECAQWIRDNLALAKRARVMLSELAWLNPADFAPGEINQTVTTGDIQPMSDYLTEIKQITADEVIAARDQLLRNRSAIRMVVSSYGPKMRTSWTAGLV